MKPRLRRELSRTVAPASVEGVDHANAYAGVELSCQLADGLSRCLQKHLQERAVDVEEGPEEIIDGEGDVEVGYVIEIAGDVSDPVVDFDLAARGAEASLAGERDAAVEATAGADVAGIAGAGIAAEDHTFDGLANVGALIGWDLAFEVQIAPGVPVFTEDACCVQHVSGSGRGRWGGRGCAKRAVNLQSGSFTYGSNGRMIGGAA